MEAHLVHASVAAPLGPWAEDADGGGGGVHGVDFFFFFCFLRLESSFVSDKFGVGDPSAPAG